MKKLLTLIIILAALGFCAYLAFKYNHADDIFGDNQIRNEINKEVVLYTSEISTDIPVSNEPAGELERIIESLKPGERDIIVPVKITVKSAIHCNRIKDINIDHEKRIVALTLPDAKYEMEGVSIDWDNITENVSWFRSNFTKKEITEFVDKAINDNKNFIAEHKAELDATAMKNAENTLTTLIAKFGYEAVISY